MRSATTRVLPAIASVLTIGLWRRDAAPLSALTDATTAAPRSGQGSRSGRRATDPGHRR